MARRTHWQEQWISTILADRYSRTALPRGYHRGHSAGWAGGAMKKNDERQFTSSVTFTDQRIGPSS